MGIDKMIAGMGKELGTTYYRIEQNIFSINLKWVEFRELFFDDDENYVIMSNSAPVFFHHVRESFLESLVLSITRITDPEKSAGKKNLTLEMLPRLIKEASLRKQVKLKIKEIKASSIFCRDWRNRIYSHNDKYLSFNIPKRPLEKGSKEKFEKLINLFNELITLISEHYLKRTIGFSFSSQCDGKRLIEIIKNEKKFWDAAEAEILKL